jgi:uncharacterized membrane protein YkoI
MQITTRKVVTVVGAAAVLAVVGTGVAIAANTNDRPEDQPIEGAALQKASDAALADTGGGKVTETEVNDEESYYQVEVTLDDGSQVDVQLDRNFHVAGSSADSEQSN